MCECEIYPREKINIFWFTLVCQGKQGKEFCTRAGKGFVRENGLICFHRLMCRKWMFTEEFHFQQEAYRINTAQWSNKHSADILIGQ